MVLAFVAWLVYSFIIAFVAWSYGYGQAEDRLQRAYAEEVKRMHKLRETTRFEVHVVDDAGAQWGAFIECVPGRKVYDALKRVAGGGRGFSQRDMTGILTRSEFDALRDELISRGFLAWRNQDAKQQGVDWTRPGLALLRAVLSPTLPQPCATVSARPARTHAHARTPAHVVLAKEVD